MGSGTLVIQYHPLIDADGYDILAHTGVKVQRYPSPVFRCRSWTLVLPRYRPPIEFPSYVSTDKKTNLVIVHEAEMGGVDVTRSNSECRQVVSRED